MKRTNLLLFIAIAISLFSMENKYPNVSGTFYSDNEKVLNEQIEQFLNNANVKLPKSKIIGILVPHAGYRYSGPTAGYAFKALQTNNYAQYKRIFIIGPSHYYKFKGLDLPDFSTYILANGNCAIDIKAVKELEHNKYFLKKNTYFYKEHSVEVELPFLNRIYPDIPIVPIVVGDINDSMIKNITYAFKPYLKDSLFIISSDLMHYRPRKVVAEADSRMLELIKNKDYKTMLQEDMAGKIEACGIYPIYIFLNLIKDDNSIQGKILNMSDSGESTYNLDNVVGYGSMVFYKEIKKK